MRLLIDRWRTQQARADRRVGLLGMILANVNRDSERRPDPFTLEEVVGWLGHGFLTREQEAHSTDAHHPTVEELAARARLLHQVYNGQVRDQ